METTEQQPMKVMAVEQCKAMGRMFHSPSDFTHRMSNSSYYKPSMLSIADYAMTQLETARAADVAMHEKNLPAMEMNKRIAVHLETLMKSIGMPEGWSERDPSSRARVPRTISHKAGWRTDLLKHCSVSDGFDSATSSYESIKARYAEYRVQALRDAEQKAGQAERDAAAKLAQRMADKDLVTIIARYNLPLESEWGDVLEALREKDQRLNLAVAMYDVRSDWNEGCGAVESALSSFTIRTDEDKDIANDVLGCTHDFEDGRVFRDTNWSYNRLFASVEDKQLSTDVQMAQGHCKS